MYRLTWSSCTPSLTKQWHNSNLQLPSGRQEHATWFRGSNKHSDAGILMDSARLNESCISQSDHLWLQQPVTNLCFIRQPPVPSSYSWLCFIVDNLGFSSSISSNNCCNRLQINHKVWDQKQVESGSVIVITHDTRFKCSDCWTQQMDRLRCDQCRRAETGQFQCSPGTMLIKRRQWDIWLSSWTIDSSTVTCRSPRPRQAGQVCMQDTLGD